MIEIEPTLEEVITLFHNRLTRLEQEMEEHARRMAEMQAAMKEKTDD